MENGLYRIVCDCGAGPFSSACRSNRAFVPAVQTGQQMPGYRRMQPFFRLPAGYGTIDFRGNLVYYLNGISD